MKIIFYNGAINNGRGHEQPLQQRELMKMQGETIMKNCISRRSFLKAAGILGAAGALAACGGSPPALLLPPPLPLLLQVQPAPAPSIKLWTYPIGGWGNDETVQNLISSFNASTPTSRSPWSIWTTPTATIR